ncbi:MAG: hypothetical protein HN368_09305, partial [Spirochaetales bacterium]|nr:hypothetical protein [Spirochaetales bacterium]
SAFAQVSPDSQVILQIMQRIGLTELEIESVVKVFEDTELIIQEANLELNIYKAQLARLLFPKDVEMREVEKLLSQSYEWQMKRQLAQIRRQVMTRQILGDERWTQYSNIIRNAQRRASEQPAAGEQSRARSSDQPESSQAQ